MSKPLRAQASSVQDATPSDSEFPLRMFRAEDKWPAFVACACDMLPLVKRGSLERDIAISMLIDLGRRFFDVDDPDTRHLLQSVAVVVKRVKRTRRAK